MCSPAITDRRELLPRRHIWTAGQPDEGTYGSEEIGRDDRDHRVSCQFPPPYLCCARKISEFLSRVISVKRLNMSTRAAIKQRLAEIAQEVEQKTADFEAGKISDKNYYSKFVHKAWDESNELLAELKACDTANRFMAGAEAAMAGQQSALGLPGLR